MATWNDIEHLAFELANDARRLFDSNVHKTMATIRSDGSPRLNGTEVVFHDGDVWIGIMKHARRSADLRRDPRVVVHSNCVGGDAWPGDAKFSGVATEVHDPAVFAAIEADHGGAGLDYDLFRVDITELSTVGMGESGDHVVVTWWTPDGGIRTSRRV